MEDGQLAVSGQLDIDLCIICAMERRVKKERIFAWKTPPVLR